MVRSLQVSVYDTCTYMHTYVHISTYIRAQAKMLSGFKQPEGAGGTQISYMLVSISVSTVCCGGHLHRLFTLRYSHTLPGSLSIHMYSLRVT